MARRRRATPMAIVDTVWERLARFNTVHRRRWRRGQFGVDRWIAALYALGRVCLWLIAGLSTLAIMLAPYAWRLLRWVLLLTYRLGRVLWLRVLPVVLKLVGRITALTWRRAPQLAAATRWIVLGACLGAAGWVADTEIRTSRFQAWLFTHLTRGMSVSLEPGTSRSLEFPKTGPYDERLGYSELPEFISALLARRYAVDSAARWSPGLARFVHAGAFPVYPEK